MKFKETKEVLVLGSKLATSIFKIMEDGKVTPVEAFQSAFGLFNPFKDGLDGIRKVSTELREATEEEKQELKHWFANELDVPNEKGEVLAEIAFNTAIEVVTNAYTFESVLREGTKSGSDETLIVLAELKTMSL